MPGGAAVLNRDIPTYPILLAAARRAGARPVRFGRSGRPEFRLGEVKVQRRAAPASRRGRTGGRSSSGSARRGGTWR